MDPKKASRQRTIYLWKKYSWIFIISGANFIKRLLDIVISLSLLIVLLPLFLVIACLIKLTDWGPIFYVSNRIGKWGQEFRFPKFRTMSIGADQLQKNLTATNEELEKRFKLRDDPRITLVGRFLRKTSLDELPQLWCVLKGEMSLVGPRPPLPDEVAKYTVEERRRLDIVPGLTCIWQVSGRSEISFDKQVQLDVQYIQSQNFFLDILLLLKTIPAIIFGKGAY